MTSDMVWDPSVFDHTFDDDTDEWFDAISHLERDPLNNLFDPFGNYNFRTVCYTDQQATLCSLDDIVEACVHYSHTASNDEHFTYLSFRHVVQHAPPDYAALQWYFAYLPADLIKTTFQNTTQYGKTAISTILHKHYKSPYLALNIRH